MQHAAARRFVHEAQMLVTQRVRASRRKRGGPCNSPAGLAARRAVRAGTCALLPPSETAARVSGGAYPMAQRFFTSSGMTPFTRIVPAGSGGR